MLRIHAFLAGTVCPVVLKSWHKFCTVIEEVIEFCMEARWPDMEDLKSRIRNGQKSSGYAAVIFFF
jgi:hypothetical protein